MRPSSIVPRATLRAAVLVAAGAIALAFGTLRASAQRPAAPPDFGPYLNRYGTRWVVAVPSLGGQRPTASLHIANTGWLPTDVAVAVFSAGGRADCAAPVPSPQRVQCIRALMPKASIDVDVEVAGDENVFVYSLASGAEAGCGAIDGLMNGPQTIATWESATWKAHPGEPIAVVGAAQAGDLSVGLTAIASTGLSELFNALPGGNGARRIQAIPQVLAYAPASGGQTLLTNADAECARVDVRSGVEGSAPSCTLPAPSTLSVAPYVAVPLPPAGGQTGSRVVAAYAAGETIGSASWREDEGWGAYSAVGLRELQTYGSVLAFPLAMAGLTHERSELWVTNLNPTATAQIDINMWDGNGALLRFHGDAEGICPGGTKRYDIASMAGDIPPVGGTDVPIERQGVKFLSLRVASKNLALATAPQIAGAIILRGDEGVEAVPGMALPLILSRPSGRQITEGGQRPRGEAMSVTVIPNVMNQYGPEHRTTTIAVTLIGNPNAENGAVADIYDAAGALVVSGIAVRGATSTAYLDLSRPMRALGGQADPPTQPFRLPAGFVGTVVLRASQGRGATFGAVAITRPTQPNGKPMPAPASGEAFDVRIGSIVPLFVDPTVPTRTPLPARPTPTATVSGEATMVVRPT
ncbi:MAG: hypothetical protein ABI780_13475, partial [Ardenticatenales bacterium]